MSIEKALSGAKIGCITLARLTIGCNIYLKSEAASWMFTGTSVVSQLDPTVS